MRLIVATGALALLLAAPAQARLAPVSRLAAKASPAGVTLTWRDRSRGETRYEVRRSGRRVVLASNARRWTDRAVEAGKRYRYSVRPCRRARCAAARSVSVATPAAPPAPAGAFAGSPRIGDCPIFPKDDAWNTDVSHAPVDRSHDYVGSLGSMTLWPDFGGDGRYGIPFVSVPFAQPLVPVSFDVAGESDPGPYPTPLDAPVEPGDRHVLVLRQGDCRLFEMYGASRQGAGWHAYSGAVWDLRSNALRPAGWTSADAAGLPIVPGLARVDEADAGAIHHALRIAIPVTQRAYIHPATHWASSSTDPNEPPMGLRLRLKASYDIGGLRGQARAIAQALKTYGAIVADNSGGRKVFISGAVDTRWNDEDLDGLKAIPASALEAVDTGPVIR
jgi:hypothetical protein